MAECKMLRARDLGLLLALSQRQIFRLNSCGKLPRPIRIGGAVRWRLADIELWETLGCPDRDTFEARKAVSNA